MVVHQKNSTPLDQTYTAFAVPARSAWYSHIESILQALLCSDQEEERRWAANKINPHFRMTPKLYLEAISVKDLVSWDTEMVHEPPLTCHLSTSQLRHFYASPMEVPPWSTHT